MIVHRRDGIRGEREYDFGEFKVCRTLQLELARAFRLACGASGQYTTAQSIRQCYQILKHFAAFIGDKASRLSMIKVVHFEEYFLSMTSSTHRSYGSTLKSVLLNQHYLKAATEVWLTHHRLPPAPTSTIGDYTANQWRSIERAARADVRAARERIHSARRLLQRLRDGELDEDHADWGIATLLDLVDKEGRAPTQADGTVPLWARPEVFPTNAVLRLTLSSREVTAFHVLLVMLTGLNSSTLEAATVDVFDPGGADGAGETLLVETDKPRRGRRRYGTSSMPGTPRWMFGDEQAGVKADLRRPGDVLRLLIDLTSLSRRFTGSRMAHQYFSTAARSGAGHMPGLPGASITRWATHHGFPNSPDGTETESSPKVDTRRIRLTFVSRTGKPVGQTPSTHRDRYIPRSGAVRSAAYEIVAEALEDQARKARASVAVVVLPGADTGPAIAEALDISLADADAMLQGRQDTLLAACSDFFAPPMSDAGQPCRASFMTCLDCRNARALPRHLPWQIAALDRMRSLESSLTSEAWARHYAGRVVQLRDIVDRYSAAEVDRARASISDEVSSLVDLAFRGRLDDRR